MIKVDKKELCCGCSACQNSCPVRCIEMKTDSEGFSYPKVNLEECIKCRKCETVCPILHPNFEISNTKEFLVAYNLAETDRMKSSSGGIFCLLAQSILNVTGIVFGATYDSENQVRHIGIEKMEDLGKILGSKYVQSEMGNCFSEVMKNIKNGKPVLFSGTPCQNAGLKKYLGKLSEADNFVLVSVICHGVPSPMVWKRYLEEISNQSIEKVNFRDKVNGWKKFHFSYVTKDGIENSEQFDKNIYMKGFLNNLFLRPSCYECEFKAEKDQSDISLGDFWGIDKLKEYFDDDKGCSAVAVKTQKGIELMKTIADNIISEPVKENEIIQYNPAYVNSPEKHKKREDFFENLNKFGVVKNIEKCIRPPFIIRMKMKIYQIISRFSKE